MRGCGVLLPVVRIIVGTVTTVGLVLSVLVLIISAIVWGFGANSSNPHFASRGKTGVLASCGTAIICGGVQPAQRW
jgi:VIT1/CCC1 family predicted Fe2+/Mn2+ transporter